MDAKAEEKLIGRITYYLSHLSVCAIEVTDGELKAGDPVHISGNHTDFIQTVGSMPMEHQKVNRAEQEKVRQHDQVFSVRLQED